MILYKVIIIISTYTNMEIERLRDLKAIGYRSMGVKISFLLYAKVSESLMTIIFLLLCSIYACIPYSNLKSFHGRKEMVSVS